MLSRKAQVAPFMVLVVVVVILAIAATVLIGELGFQRIRLSNIADSSLLSAASSLCRSLNQIRLLHNQMFLNYIAMQTMALAGSVWASKAIFYAASLYYIQTGYELYDKAEEVAEEAAEDLRPNIYDAVFGGALVDERKPFLESEVTRNAQGRVIGLDYASYLQRDSNFTLSYRSFKTSSSGWYGNSVLSYSFNKTESRVLAQPGVFNAGEPNPGYESYLRVELQDVPTDVSVSAQFMVIFALCCYPCKAGCCTLPCFSFLPWAWIRKIDIDSNNFGVRVRKHVPFTTLPFFGREVDLEHTNRIAIRGSVWSGYEFRMEQ